MRWFREHPLATTSVLVFVLALVVRLGFWSEIQGTAADRWHDWDQSDMATYLAQARQLAEQDWLAREPVHPYHTWQRVAPPEKWLEWYGPHAFHQAPAYAYLLALLGLGLDDPLPLVKLAQLILGAGTCVLLVWIGTRVAGLAAGCVGGVLAALYAPLLYLEPQVLREGPAIFFMLALVWLLLRHVDAGERPWKQTLRSCAVLGVAVGLFSTFHEMGSVLALVVLITLVVHHGRTRLPRAGAALAAVLVGYLVGFAPLLARNLTVGASPLSVSCRAHINFVEANEATALEGGANFIAPGPAIISILDEAQGSFPKAVQGVWASYEGDYGRMLSNWLQRFGFVWQRWEQADNTSLYFYRRVSRVLEPLPDFRLVFPLGLAGAVLVLVWPLLAWARRRRTGEEPLPEAGPGAIWARAPAGHLVLLLYLLGVAASLSLVHAVARFRLYLVAYFLIYAGVAVVLLVGSLRERRFARAGAVALLLVLGVWLQGLATPEWAVHQPRRVDYTVATQLSLEDGWPERALELAEDAAGFFPRDPTLFALVGRHFEVAQDWQRAAEVYRRGLELRPGARLLRERLAHVLQQQ